ncbi:ring-cleaving dioxygenase [Haloarcula pellucida]|uniref:Diguanylate cyclase n=1 Tax=Haloarcula pellucida TaxID=1427151 RepID=A0A830GNQ1_9EURY|nr:ring-cleaving dioxygenase [Halomicroarcula pellucida]MBX0347884.1 ring-cleaving dioxygenase [Halomicroarcula pellucida]GGN95897.1 diguanylate cyclase [Halomicroarcula pellucida]
MSPATSGLHHVTAIAGDPQRNADFYVGTLGLRFVKKTVNHDDTGTYHFYFGDEEGTPGTTITFFPWTDRGRRGEFGAGQTQATAYLIPEDSVDYWTDRLESHDVAVERTERFESGERSASESASATERRSADTQGAKPRTETVLQFDDPDGIGLELVATDAETEAVPWEDSPVPEEHQLRGLYSVTLAVESVDPTGGLLTDVLGYEHEVTEDGRHRYRSTTGEFGSVVDVVETDESVGRMGVGTVHHVAFRVEDVAELEAYREAYEERGLEPSEIIDRTYFTALYCREPNGVLVELSTVGPGFTADEPRSELGESLTLPEWLEDEREEIEARLPPFDGANVPAE